MARKRVHLWSLCLILAAQTLAAQTLAAQTLAAQTLVAQTLADKSFVNEHLRLQEAQYATTALTVPAEGLTFRQAEATWTLESGTLRLQEPTTDGYLTGLVFEGRGRFHMAIPDPVEQAQWRRMAERDDEHEVDEPFSALVLRGSGNFIKDLLTAGLLKAGPKDTTYAQNDLAHERHEHWRVQRFFDADARVLASLLTPGDDYLRIGMKTDAFDWLTYEYDSQRQEEILISRYDGQFLYLEKWISLDRPKDRREDGRPGRRRDRQIDLRHVDLDIDLTRPGKRPRAGLHDIHPRRVRFTANLTFTAEMENPRALRFILSPAVEVKSVKTGSGQELEFLRDHIGKRSKSLDNQLYDSSLVVVLERPLARGEERQLILEYELEILNFVRGRSWYPGEPDGLRDEHTAKLTITSRKKDDVRAMGRLTDERQEEKTQTQTWEVTRPAKIVTFSFAEKFYEESLVRQGAPEVIAFAASKGQRKNTLSVAEDMSESLVFYQNLFQSPLEAERIYITSVIGTHGQSFDGFIHLSERSFDLESEGPTELFRSHEAAHQWWGHQVVWSSYRDQWLSEGLAQYSAMIFVEKTLEKGKKYYDEIIQSYIGQVFGAVPPSRFARRALESNSRHRQRIGPISVGYRASTAKTQGGFTLQSYFKGALVLHMLRTLLRNQTGGDEAFEGTLRDFLKSHRGGEVATEDLAAALSGRAPGDWSWFFDQWVDGTAIPTYTWSHEVTPVADGIYQLRVVVEQSGVPEGFRMPVPIEVVGVGQEGEPLVIQVDGARSEQAFMLNAKPKKVTFNPGGAVLARVKKR